MVVRVQELEEQRARVAAKRFEVDASYVLERLVTIDKMDIIDVIDEDGRLRPVKEWPEVWRQFVGQFEVEEIFAGRGDERLNIGLLKKLKWPDKLRNLELLGKHVNVNAFKEVQEHTGPGGGPLRLVHRQMTAQEAAEAYADTLNNG
jgi:phage terminase small subunit